MAILGLTEPDWRSLIEAVVLGFGGGAIQWGAAKDPASKQTWLQAAAIGAVAAVGALWLTPPDSALAVIAQSLLVGFFGQAVIATLQARITAGIAKDRLAQIARIASTELGSVTSAAVPAGAAAAAAAPAPTLARSLDHILTLTEVSK